MNVQLAARTIRAAILATAFLGEISVMNIDPSHAARAKDASQNAQQWNEAECVFTGKLEAVQAGPVANSYPPIYHHTLEFVVEKVFRGPIKSGDRVTCVHLAHQLEAPKFPVNEVCLVAAKRSHDSLQALVVEAADAKRVTEVEAACSLPLGWKMEDGKPVSPWASLGQKAWPEGTATEGRVVCGKTGRPALLAGKDATFEVEPVPPKQAIQWTNPDGDGEYKITVSNKTDKPLAVPALLSDGKQILWNESLVILCQGRAYVCPGCQGVAAKVEPATLKPGESVTTTVNALRLDGPDWPQGGYRIEFQFCLGEKSQTKSFYYMTNYHGKLRAATGK